MEVEYEVSSYQVPAELSFAHQLSPAQQCSAVPCRPLPLVLCGAVPCCVLYCTCSFVLVHARSHSKYHARYRYTRFVRTTLLNHDKCTPSSAQLSYSSAAQRSAVRCALPCGTDAVPCALCLLSYIPYQVSCEVPRTRYRHVGVCCCVSSVCVLFFTCVIVFLRSFFVLSRSFFFMFFFRKLHPYCPSERDIASKHTTHHKTINSAQAALGVIKSLVALTHVPLIAAPVIFCCIIPYASVAKPLFARYTSTS